MFKKMWWMIIVMAWLGLTTHSTLAQEVVLQLAVSEFDVMAYTPALLSPFEAQYGVRVQLVVTPVNVYQNIEVAATGDELLNAVAAYVSSADVLAVNGGMLSPIATRSGAYLDLSPLVNSDTTLYGADFFPAAWQAYQWDGGFWALPQSFELSTVLYDQLAFDTLNLAYPNAGWTLDDFASAARVLAQRDASGNVIAPALTYFSANNAAAFLRGLLGSGWYDANTLPQNPRLATPELAALLDTWAQLQHEGVVGQMNNGVLAPLTIAPLGFLPDPVASMATPMPTTQRLRVSLLPNATAAADVRGFAVSGGTAYPELGYELVKFLSQSSELMLYSGGFPAQRWLLNAESRPEGYVIGIRTFPADLQTLLEQALEVALPPSELRYASYLTQAFTLMNTVNYDAMSALAQVEAQVYADLQTADARRSTPIIVNAPNQTPNGTEISLRFGIGSLVLPVPNSEGWQRVIDEFVASDPQVGEVILHTDFTAPENFLSVDDCFYLPYNALSRIDTSSIRALDPFLSADASFIPSDVVSGALQQVQYDNLMWALPINLQPAVLRYDAARFEQAGLPLPANGWTSGDFQNVLMALRPNVSDPAAFAAMGNDGTHLMLLIAAYGGLPLDYRTTPPTVNFTEPMTVEAIRQVLELVRAGYISYSELATTNSSFVPIENVAITTDTLNGFGFFGQQPQQPMVGYPIGSQYSGVSYSLGTAYISASAQNVEACYRFITMLAQHTEIFGAMPARSSLIAAQEVTQGAEAVTTYQQLDALMRQSNAVVFPTLNTQTALHTVTQWWLYRAFDDYVLRGQALESALVQAETMAHDFEQCVTNAPDQTQQCATLVDPTLTPLFAQFQ